MGCRLCCALFVSAIHTRDRAPSGLPTRRLGKRRAGLILACGFPVLVGACQFGTAWAGLRLNSFIHSIVACGKHPSCALVVVACGENLCKQTFFKRHSMFFNKKKKQHSSISPRPPEPVVAVALVSCARRAHRPTKSPGTCSTRSVLPQPLPSS